MRGRETLEAILEKLPGCLLAYSGGVDSTLLLAVAAGVLGRRCLAVTVETLFHEPGEIEDARRRAEAIGARHRVVTLPLAEGSEVMGNPPDRCYHCKKTIFTRLGEMARREGLETVIEASHTDDLRQRRPGVKALAELGVRSPLVEAGLDKAGVRELSRQMGLEGADRPSRPCLATRIPYGRPITAEALSRVAAAEKVLAALGFTSPRVRDYGSLARIELLPDEMDLVDSAAFRHRISGPLGELGYIYVTLDLQGYRSGSMDEVLTDGER